MKKVLYISNIEVPYKVKFFNELAKECNLTVVYERENSSNRDTAWTKSETSAYKKVILKGIPIGREYSIAFGLLKFLKGYDVIVISCINSPIQLLFSLILRILRIPYYLSFDGEIFVGKSGIKSRLKRFFMKGAYGYFAAGEQSAKNIQKVVKNDRIYTYYFSSLTEDEIRQHSSGQKECKCDPKKDVLVIGQYFDYKGLDLAVEVAKQNPDISYIFVGMGGRCDLFVKEQQIESIPNIEVIPFLQKKDLEELYKTCKVLLLPSRKECWGLVVNEAASFGIPIVSTKGSGAAVEFLRPNYGRYLAKPGDAKDLYKILSLVLEEDTTAYQDYLIKKSQTYSVEAMKDAFVKALKLSLNQ